MPSVLTPERLTATRATLESVQTAPDPVPPRQPVHTLYGGAHLFTADTARKMGQRALKALSEYAPDAHALAECLRLDEALAGRVHERVVAKLAREPVEDFRIDFEDGYGPRPDAEEDGHAESAAREVARGLAEGGLPPFLGIRLKPLLPERLARSARTLERFLGTLLEHSGGALPPHFVVTLPKVTAPEQAAALAYLLDLLEAHQGLPYGTLKLELMVESPRALFGPDGRLALPGLVDAARGRCTGVHFGPYDYTASVSITAQHQRLTHPACDYAREVMQVALAGRPVMLADGPTSLLPVGPHREGAQPLTAVQREDNRQVVHRAWRLMHANVRQALERGFYQGWDLHPAQLPIRYATVYAFFLEGLEMATLRLKSFVEQAARAMRSGEVFDDAATGQGLLNSFLRGHACGALTADELRATGLTVVELRERSFGKILENRRG
jgi:citrate lyase beta subunit